MLAHSPPFHVNNFGSIDSLFQEEFQDLYSAEWSVADAMPMLLRTAMNCDLRDVLIDLFVGQAGQVGRLEFAFELLGSSPRLTGCQVVAGILEDAETRLDASDVPATRDIAILGVLQEIQIYKLRGYDAAFGLADGLGLAEISGLIGENRAQDDRAAAKLRSLVVNGIGARWPWDGNSLHPHVG